MPYCPNCQTEYYAGVKTCADCGVPLVEHLISDPAGRGLDGEQLEAVCEVDDEREAEEIRARLEQNGIRTLLDHNLVKVLTGDAGRALDLIKGYLDPGADADLVAVFDAPDSFLATTVESLLQHEGISATVQSRQMPMYDGLALMQNPVWGKVLVLAPDEARAKNIVQTFMKAAAELDATEPAAPACPSCGAALRPAAKFCDRCGAKTGEQ